MKDIHFALLNNMVLTTEEIREAFGWSQYSLPQVQAWIDAIVEDVLFNPYSEVL